MRLLRHAPQSGHGMGDADRDERQCGGLCALHSAGAPFQLHVTSAPIMHVHCRVMQHCSQSDTARAAMHRACDMQHRACGVYGALPKSQHVCVRQCAESPHPALQGYTMDDTSPSACDAMDDAGYEILSKRLPARKAPAASAAAAQRTTAATTASAKPVAAASAEPAATGGLRAPMAALAVN